MNSEVFAPKSAAAVDVSASIDRASNSKFEQLWKLVMRVVRAELAIDVVGPLQIDLDLMTRQWLGLAVPMLK